jgi:cytochrome oxidase Cu insertion factor (SCO1/SenC/PrrC family)
LESAVTDLATHRLDRPRFERVPLLLFVAWLGVTLGWWGLAFVTVSPSTPEWLARTQYVCFGNLADGLPDTYGWARLILAPLGMLAPLLAVHGRGIGQGVRAAWRRPAGRLLVCVLVALTLVEGAWVGARIRTGLAIDAERIALPSAPDGLPAAYPRLDRPAPDFRLVDQHGISVALGDLRGQVLYLTFAFAHCNATCPLTVRSMLQAARDSAGIGARPVVVTLDPWRDTPSALPGAAAQWGLEGLGSVLSGTVPQVLGVLARYELPTQRDPNTGDIAHPALVYVIDRSGRIAYVLNNPPPAWIAEAGRRAAQG